MAGVFYVGLQQLVVLCVCVGVRVCYQLCGCCLRCSMAERPVRKLSDKYSYLQPLPSSMHPGLALFLRRIHHQQWFDRESGDIWDKFAYTSRANFRDTRLIEINFWNAIQEVD